jgi:hypothetical protein
LQVLRLIFINRDSDHEKSDMLMQSNKELVVKIQNNQRIDYISNYQTENILVIYFSTWLTPYFPIIRHIPVFLVLQFPWQSTHLRPWYKLYSVMWVDYRSLRSPIYLLWCSPICVNNKKYHTWATVEKLSGLQQWFLTENSKTVFLYTSMPKRFVFNFLMRISPICNLVWNSKSIMPAIQSHYSYDFNTNSTKLTNILYFYFTVHV